MTQLTELVDQYIATWNETDIERRRALIAQTWTENASYLDPVMQGEGHAGIDAMIQAVQERFAGHQFHRRSKVDAHHDRIRFAWSLAPASGPEVVTGIDFGVVADGRLQSITGFFDHVPAAQPEV